MFTQLNAENSQAGEMKQWLIFMLAAGAAGCSAGPYDHLASTFASTASSSGEPIAARTIVLSSRDYREPFTYRETIAIRLSPGSVEIEPAGAFGMRLKKLRIPRSAIALCSQTCFGSSRWDANLLLAEPPVEISIPNAKEVIDWCWEQRVPIASAETRRKWMNENGMLPDPSTLAYQLSSRATFDHAVKQACLGY